jgi:hypothetical protein
MFLVSFYERKHLNKNLTNSTRTADFNGFLTVTMMYVVETFLKYCIGRTVSLRGAGKLTAVLLYLDLTLMAYLLSNIFWLGISDSPFSRAMDQGTTLGSEWHFGDEGVSCNPANSQGNQCEH